MATVRKREAAKRDLIAQWVWYAENAEDATADRFLDAVSATAEMLAQHPEIGTRVQSTNRQLNGLRSFPITDGFDSILIWYLPLPNGIEILRVVHGSRDLKKLLQK